ncbi:hypothetical protein HNR23_002919 [Nocardiopsis mwathae]|uniref:DUF6504 domain-containing protein n=1 Tax=Nocardiopsis mwathae TaxID=1472723 RepID=A0A7W9YIR4_9ACTN|nr:hypothetical protein [Nocardiopsis mwathae]
MARVYGVRISVVDREGRPQRFTWDGRIYTVRRIIDHWVTLRTDWTPAAHDRLPQRTFWRVEAGADRAPGVYELRHDSTTGEWLLARVWD